MTQSLNLALDFSFETRDVCVEILLLGCRHRGLALHARHRTLEVDPLHHLVSMVLFQTIPFNDFKSYEPQRACVLQSLHSMNLCLVFNIHNRSQRHHCANDLGCPKPMRTGYSLLAVAN